MFHPRFETFSRFHRTAVALVGVLGLLIWWSPDDWGRNGAKAADDNVSLSDRVWIVQELELSNFERCQS